MRTSTRDRLVLPILLPLGIVVGVAAVLYLFSRVLLSLTADAATATALIVAFSILVVATIAASRTVIRASTLASMVGAIAGVALLAGGIALVAVGSTGGGAAVGPAVTLQLAAKNLAFDTTSLAAPAQKPFAISFDNQDAGVQHDVQIFDNKDFSGTPLFNGQIITGVARVTYDVRALATGTYYFHCVVHPTTMHGTLTVKPAPAGGGGTPAGGGGATLTVIAQNLQFDTSTIDLPGNAASSIQFENKDPGVQHNIAIFTDSSLSTRLFTGSLVAGPGAADYKIPPLAPGTYYFHCDVHPTMNGKVSVG